MTPTIYATILWAIGQVAIIAVACWIEGRMSE